MKRADLAHVPTLVYPPETPVRSTLMKMGVKEFRERFSAVADAGQQVIVTKNGRIVGRYEPVDDAGRTIDWTTIEQRLEAFRTGFRATTPEWEAKLASIGLDTDGEPIDPCA